MIAKIIEFSVRNRWLVIITWLGIALWGLYAVFHTPVDAIPDLSENQVIVFTDWMGRSPQDIEEQITYPLSVQLQGLAGVKAIRSSSEFNFSMINIIFDESTNFYFARTRVLERLGIAQTKLPQGVVPYLAPDATALGQIFWYTVEGDGYSLDQLRALQDYNIRYQLASVPGVSEVASVGGFVREYQVDINPVKLRAYDLSLGSVYSAIARSNMSVGGKTIVNNSSEYIVRGVGWLRDMADLESVIIETRQGVPLRVKDVATVQMGPEYRRSALEKNGRETVGGVVMMRYGGNPLAITEQIKQKIRALQAGLPQGVRVVPFYDRTRLIESAIHTVTGTLKEEMIIATIAILLILAHARSAFVVCITLPLAVAVSFLFMYYLGISSNIMSMCGIAISIGILVDAAVVMVENATHELKLHFGDQRVSGDTTEIIVRSCRLVGRPIFFSVLIMLLAFLPVFAFAGQEGKLSHPLAYTKSFAMLGVALLAVTLVPALIPLLIRGKLKSEEDNWIVRSFIHIYKPTLSWVIDRPAFVYWLMAVILSLGAGFVGNPYLQQLIIGLGVLFILLGVKRSSWLGRALGVVTLLAVAFIADTRFHKLGGEFMPSLNEGSILDMPTSAPRIAIGQAVDDVMLRDRIMRGFPEVENVVGKVGRADTATDPSPVDMVETIITLQPGGQWPKRTLKFDDLVAQAGVVAQRLQDEGTIAGANLNSGDWKNAVRAVGDGEYLKYNPRLSSAVELLNVTSMGVSERFDRAMRDLARRRQLEYAPELARQLAEVSIQFVIDHLRMLPPVAHPLPASPKGEEKDGGSAPQGGKTSLAPPQGGVPSLSPPPWGRAREEVGEGALLREVSAADHQAMVEAILPHVSLLVESMRQEEVDAMLSTLRKSLVSRGIATDRDDLLLDPPHFIHDNLKFFKQAAGLAVATPAERLFTQLEAQREKLWEARTKTLNWELFDYGVTLANNLLIDGILRSSKGTVFESSSSAPSSAPAAAGKLGNQTTKPISDAGVPASITDALNTDLHKRLFLWQKSKDDVLKEMDSELQMPGWGNAWTQPIINRVNMLATGVRTQIGVKVFGPTGKPLEASIADVQRVSEEIAAKLRKVRGAVDVVPDQAVGKRYVEIRVDQEKARYYGVNMAELAQAIEVAIGGSKVTATVEGREGFPVRIRYARDYWQDVNAIGDVLLTARATPVELLKGGGGSTGSAGADMSPAAPSPAGGGMGGSVGMGGGASADGVTAPADAGMARAGGATQSPISNSQSRIPSADLPASVLQIPLRMVADIRVTEGPSMIKSENGRLRNYVTLNVRDRDVLGFVSEAQQTIKGIEAKLAGTGMSVEWTGEFEAQVRARQTMAIIFPMVIGLILLLLFITFHDFADSMLVSLAVVGALAGAIMFQAAFGFNFSVIVSIGYVAAFGMATQTGVIMLVYLREALDRHGGLEEITSLQELRTLVIQGAVHRLRPKLLTEGVAIVGLVPMLWATGTGSEIMRPMAAPVLGGLLISDEVIDLMIPVLFYWIRRRRWLKLHGQTEKAAVVEAG